MAQIPKLGNLGFGTLMPFVNNLPRMVGSRVRFSMPDHGELIDACSVKDTTKNESLTPMCLWAGQTADGNNFSVWVWVSTKNDAEMLSVVTNFLVGGKAQIGIEFARIGWNAFEVKAKTSIATFTALTATDPRPAIGYQDFAFDVPTA